MNKKFVALFVLLIVGCALCFANGTSESGAQKTKAYKVGVINVSDADENCYLAFKTFKDVVESADFEAKIGHKVTVEWTSSDLDVAKQMNNCETLLSKGVDAILMVGLDNDSSSSVVKTCNEAGVDIFMVASEATEGIYKFIGFNEYDCGYHQGQYVVDQAKAGDNVCILEGIEGRSATIERGQGIDAALAQRKDINVLAKQTGEFTAEKAMQVTEDWVQAYGDKINWIITEDNKMGQGAIEVLKAANLIGKVNVDSWIVSGTWDAKLMKDGYLPYCVYVSFSVLGETMSNVIADYYNGKEVPDRSYMNLYDVTPENYSEYFK